MEAPPSQELCLLTPLLPTRALWGPGCWDGGQEFLSLLVGEDWEGQWQGGGLVKEAAECPVDSGASSPCPGLLVGTLAEA